jgi:transmembrane sensor
MIGRRDRAGEAARWFAAKRRGVMTVEERAACAQWLRDPENAAAMTELDRVWAIVGVAERDLRGADEMPAKPNRAVRSALVAAMCAVSIGIAALSYGGNPNFWTTLDWTDR